MNYMLKKEQKLLLKFSSFSEFYPFYLQEHSNKTNKKLHWMGTTLAMTIIILAVILHIKKLFFLAPVFGYGFAWFGHFVYEKNKPASFKFPLYSFMGDMKMWY